MGNFPFTDRMRGQYDTFVFQATRAIFTRTVERRVAGHTLFFTSETVKYDARIEFTFDDSTDTHGISGQEMCVIYRKDPKGFQYEQKKLSDGYGVDTTDLKEVHQ